MADKKNTVLLRDKWIHYVHGLQDRICTALEEADGQEKFAEDRWERSEGKGGGGKTRIISGGKVFEKGGVNTSVVYGEVSDIMRKQLQLDGDTWFACGLSLVMHPFNPFVPTVHANWRYFELYDNTGKVISNWFGGGTDLTPYYLFEEDAKHFHGTLKKTLAPFGENLYDEYKKQCDHYFVNKHRHNEARGIGGIFYDHLCPKNTQEAERLLAFQQANGDAFLESYLPLIDRRKTTPFTEKHKRWQEIRRGRYVEFNLLHDRGTLFGLHTNGRTESILMSLPPTVRFEYDDEPEPGSAEHKLLQVCRNPVDWV